MGHSDDEKGYLCATITSVALLLKNSKNSCVVCFSRASFLEPEPQKDSLIAAFSVNDFGEILAYSVG